MSPSKPTGSAILLGVSLFSLLKSLNKLTNEAAKIKFNGSKIWLYHVIPLGHLCFSLNCLNLTQVLPTFEYPVIALGLLLLKAIK